MNNGDRLAGGTCASVYTAATGDACQPAKVVKL